MPSPQLVHCQACGIATYEWTWVLVELGGRTILDLRLCQRHADAAAEAARQAVKDASA